MEERMRISQGAYASGIVWWEKYARGKR